MKKTVKEEIYTFQKVCKEIFKEKDDEYKNIFNDIKEKFPNIRREYLLLIIEKCGFIKLLIMSEKLNDTKLAFSDWAFRFAMAMERLGDNACANKKDLYEDVIKNEGGELKKYTFDEIEDFIIDIYCREKNTSKESIKYVYTLNELNKKRQRNKKAKYKQRKKESKTEVCT